MRRRGPCLLHRRPRRRPAPARQIRIARSRGSSSTAAAACAPSASGQACAKSSNAPPTGRRRQAASVWRPPLGSTLDQPPTRLPTFGSCAWRKRAPPCSTRPRRRRPRSPQSCRHPRRRQPLPLPPSHPLPLPLPLPPPLPYPLPIHQQAQRLLPPQRLPSRAGVTTTVGSPTTLRSGPLGDRRASTIVFGAASTAKFRRAAGRVVAPWVSASAARRAQLLRAKSLLRRLRGLKCPQLTAEPAAVAPAPRSFPVTQQLALRGVARSLPFQAAAP
jgi:hypothetical protein